MFLSIKKKLLGFLPTAWDVATDFQFGRSQVNHCSHTHRHHDYLSRCGPLRSITPEWIVHSRPVKSLVNSLDEGHMSTFDLCHQKIALVALL